MEKLISKWPLAATYHHLSHFARWISRVWGGTSSCTGHPSSIMSWCTIESDPGSLKRNYRGGTGSYRALMNIVIYDKTGSLKVTAFSNEVELILELKIDQIVMLKQSAEGMKEEVIFDHLHATAFQYTPFGRTILGCAENVRTITKCHLQNYISTHYTAPRMVLFV